MQYTIDQIEGGQIYVSFADNSRAIVRIETDDSPEMIDERVGAFTNEYVLYDTPNANISVGEVRNTVDPVAAQEARDQAARDAAADREDIPTVDTGTLSEVTTPFEAYIYAQYLEKEFHDCQLLDAINARVAQMYQENNITKTQLLAAFNDTL